jgi:hypothetical protein
MHSSNTFGVRMSHRQIQTHKTHHSPNLEEATTFPLIVYSMPGHETNTQMSFCLGTPKWESQILTTWTPTTLEVHNFTCRPPIEMRFKAKLYPSLRIFPTVCHTPPACKEIEAIFDSHPLTHNFFLGHNLCLKRLNGSCEPILDIYVSRTFQWYKELNLLNFDTSNRFLKIWEFIGTPTPKVETPFGVWGFIPSHFLTLSGPMKCDSQNSFLARNLISPYFGLEPEAKVTTIGVS